MSLDPDTVAAHKAVAPKTLTGAVVTVSTSRTLATDGTGKLIRELLEAAGHRVVHHVVVTDDADALRVGLRTALATAEVQFVIFNGGTGLARSDVTVETLVPLFDKPLSAFGVLFAVLSYEQVQTAALLSRATAGLIDGRAVFCLPGSPKACRLAMEKLILPELGHILKHAGDA